MKFKRLKAIPRSELTDEHQVPVVYGYIAEGRRVVVNLDANPPQAIHNKMGQVFGGTVGVATNHAGSGERCLIAPLNVGTAIDEQTMLIRTTEFGVPDYDYVLIIEEYEGGVEE